MKTAALVWNLWLLCLPVVLMSSWRWAVLTGNVNVVSVDLLQYVHSAGIIHRVSTTCITDRKSV